MLLICGQARIKRNEPLQVHPLEIKFNSLLHPFRGIIGFNEHKPSGLVHFSFNTLIDGLA